MNYFKHLWREDERALTLASQHWTDGESTPQAFSVMAPPPLTMQLAPPPRSTGGIDLVTVNNGPALDPASTFPTPLGIPDDLSPAVKWGALAYLLSIDGQARDSSRAMFCAQRYDQYVQLAQLLSAVVNSEIEGVPTIPDTIYGLDAGVPDWQNIEGAPNYLGLAGWNLMAVYPVPPTGSTFSATLDVVRKAPIPDLDADYVQIGQEQLDSLVEYAVHLALFKCGGMEFAVTQRLADEFMLQAMTYNQRLSASARYVIAPKESSQREKAYRARRSQSEGLGALPSVQEAQSFSKTNAPTRIRNNA